MVDYVISLQLSSGSRLNKDGMCVTIAIFLHNLICHSFVNLPMLICWLEVVYVSDVMIMVFKAPSISI